MPVLSQAEQIILAQFHEERGDRMGAEVGQCIPLEELSDLEDITPGVEFDGAVRSLVAKGLLSAEEDDLCLTQAGYDYLYASQDALR
jgi:hypothetical protein